MFRLPVRWLQYPPQPHDDLAIQLVISLDVRPEVHRLLTQVACHRQLPVGAIVAGVMHSGTVRELLLAQLR